MNFVLYQKKKYENRKIKLYNLRKHNDKNYNESEKTEVFNFGIQKMFFSHI